MCIDWDGNIFKMVEKKISPNVNGGMMKKLIIGIALMIFMTESAHLWAESLKGNNIPYRGNEYIKECNSEKITQIQWCYAFTYGVMAGILAEYTFEMIEKHRRNGGYDEKFGQQFPPSSCIPDGVSSAQMSKIVLKYLETNPEKRHQYAAYLIREAFIKAFPCKK